MLILKHMEQLNVFILSNLWLIIPLAIWSVVWKGIALWKAARLGQRNWFIALLVFNTAGLLEIIYIFAVVRGKTQAMIERE